MPDLSDWVPFIDIPEAEPEPEPEPTAAPESEQAVEQIDTRTIDEQPVIVDQVTPAEPANTDEEKLAEVVAAASDKDQNIYTDPVFV